MRAFAIVTILLSFVAFILSFLCLFAGNKPSSMQNYYLISLNTSEVGANLVASAGGAGGVLGGIISGIDGAAGDVIPDIAHAVGVKDFYSLFVLDYCEGFYTPISVPNATISASHIGKNATFCSGHNKRYTPGAALQADLDAGGKGITLSDFDWPTEIDDKFKTLYDVVEAVEALYAVAIFFSFITILLSLWWFLRNNGRCSIILTSLCAFLVFICLGVASGGVTAIIVKGVDVINQYGDTLGLVALKGNKFMALTWAATACAFIAWILATAGICCGGGGSSRRERRAKRISV